MPPCPEPERLAAYLDGQLFPEQRERLEEHLARCGRCTNALADSVRFQTRHGLPLERTQMRWLAAAAMVAMVAVPAVVWLATRAEGPPWRRDPRAPLIAATRDERPLVPRLTGGFHWAPLRETVRSATAVPSTPVAWATYAAADLVRKQATARPSADHLGALADAHLLAGETDQALMTLTRATVTDPGDARLQSDLAAVYLARGQQRGDAADIAAAVELSSAAMNAEPALLEARFNQALALEALHLDVEARQAWKNYLDAENERTWAGEARQHLEALASEPTSQQSSAVELRRAAEVGDPELAALVAGHRYSARRLVERELLPQWGALLAHDSPRAARTLATAQSIARLYAAQTGDSRIEKELAEALAVSGFPAERLGHAHHAIARGETALEAFDIAAARRELERAASLFPAGSVGRRRATVELLVCDYATAGSSPALVAALAQVDDGHGEDLATRARVLWLRGLSEVHLGDEAAAIGHYTAALTALDRLGETEPTAWLHYLLGEVLALAGNDRAAWTHRAAAIAAIPRLEDSNRSYGILAGSATSALQAGQPRLAKALLEELSARGYADTPIREAELRLRLARVELRLGNRPVALAHLARAGSAVHGIGDAAMQRRLAADFDATRGTITPSPQVAVTALSRALTTFGELHATERLPGLLLERARAYRRAGGDALAERDLNQAIALLETHPALDLREDLWLNGTDLADFLYDEMASLALSRDDSIRAFSWVERAGNRDLATVNGEATAISRPSPALPAQLEAGTTVLAYRLLGGRALLWRIDRGGLRLIPLHASPDELKRLAANLDADLVAGSWTRGDTETAARLYRELVAPAALDADVRKLVVVPDPRLAALPFAALVDGRGRFLIETSALTVSPSVGYYLHARRRWRSLAAETASAMVVGDPRTDGRVFPGLESLPGAADEARRVARLYPDATLALGEAATRTALVASMGSRAIVHVAAHAMVDDSLPSRSALALAPGNDSGGGSLYAEEIRDLSLPLTRTVVLAVCGSTSSPRPGDTAGRLGLASAFLAADVPTVVATLWPVKDQRTVALVTALHTRLRAGDDPATALRFAQLQQLTSSDGALRSPATWALFQALGG